jgi:heme/copper-type cytochrome/quinol oxidase subunit 3
MYKERKEHEMKEKIEDLIFLAKEVIMYSLCFAAFAMILFAPYIFPTAFGG